MSREISLYLEDITNSIKKIQTYTDAISKDQLFTDDRTYDAVVFNLQIIGEASKNIPENIRDRYSQVEWKKIIGLRNIIAHAYFSLEDDILWDILQTKLAPLKTCVEQIQQNENLD